MGLQCFSTLKIFEEFEVLPAVLLKTQAILPNDNAKITVDLNFLKQCSLILFVGKGNFKLGYFLTEKKIDICISVLSCNLLAERTLLVLTGSTMMSVVTIIT